MTAKKIILEIWQIFPNFLWEGSVKTYYDENQSFEQTEIFLKPKQAQAWLLWMASQELLLLPMPEYDFDKKPEKKEE